MKSIWLIALLLMAAGVFGKTVTRTVEYKHGEVTLEGYLAYDDASSDQRPGVLVVHEWYGLNENARMRAEKLAQLGYVALAVDIYGKGIRPKNNEEAGAQAGKYKGDRPLMRGRIIAALEELRRHPLVDSQRIAAIGYCFGGTTVLELARSGADIAGVVSFHGGLDTPDPADARNIKCKILVCHGADDPHVPAEQVTAFQNEMRSAGVDWQMIYYGGAVHSFTNSGLSTDNSQGAAYNADADRRSRGDMNQFFAEIFK